MRGEKVVSIRSLYAGKPRGRTVPDVDVPAILREFEQVQAERMQHEPRWRDVFDYAMPDRGAFDLGRVPGQQTTEAVDSHPIYAMRRGAGNILGALMPAERKWVELEAGGDIPEEQRDAVNSAVEKYRDVLFDHINRSNFQSEAHAMTLDLMVSLGGMVVERGTPEVPLRIVAYPLAQLWPIAGPTGDIVGMMRRYECELGHVETMYEGMQARVRLPQAMQDAKERDPKKKVTLLEVSRGVPRVGQRLTVLAMDSRDVLLDHVGTDPDEPPRWIVPRLFRAPGNVYGTGPAVEAEPSMRLLNIIMSDDAKAARLNGAPPLLVDTRADLNGSTMRLTPRALNYYNGVELAGAPPVFPVPLGGSPVYNQAKAQELREQIDRILFAQSVLPPVSESHRMTAAEVMVRRQELLRDQGVDFGRIQREFLFSFVARAVWVLQSFGIVPPILKVDGRRFKVRYAGPLAQAQDADEATVMASTVSDMMQVFGPEATALAVKVEDAGAEYARKRNFPASLIRTEGERVKMQQAAAEAAAAQAQAQTQQVA